MTDQAGTGGSRETGGRGEEGFEPAAGGDRPAVAGIEGHVLGNGLEVVLVRRSGVPLVTVEVAVRAGSMIQTPDLNGLTHLHEHMFFKANRAIPDQETYLRRLDELGASWNGSTSVEVVRYHFTTPSSLLRPALVFLRDAITAPLFLAGELEKEREVVLGEYDRAEATPEFHLRRALERLLFERHFSRKNVIGDRAVIAAASREQLSFIQDAYYVPNNAALIITGEFDRAAALALAAELFGGWPRRPDPFERSPVPRHPPLERDRFEVLEQDVRAASILLGWHGPSVIEDPEGAVAADVVCEALNHPGSRFRRALVDSGLAAEASIGYATLRHTGPLVLRIETEPAKVLAALTAARRELDELSDPAYLAPGEIERAASDLVLGDALERERSREFAISLGFWWSVGGIGFYLDYPDRVRAVRPDQAAAFARRYLPAGGARTAGAVMLSPEGRTAAGITAAAVERAFAAPAASPGPSRPAPAAASAGGPLPAGARALAIPMEGIETAALGVYFRCHPERSGARLAGLERLLLGTLADLLERTRGEELARLGIRPRLRVGPDVSLLGVSCLQGSLERAADILGDTLRRIEVRPEDLERNRARLLDARAKRMDNPDSAVPFVADRSFLPPGHPYLGYPGGTEESLRAIRIEDLQARRELLLTGSRILVAAAGDVREGDALALAERIAGGLPPGQPPLEEVPPAGGPPPRLNLEERAIPTCYILGKFRAPAPGHPEFEPLSLALSILHRKLFLEVRTRRALTYSVASAIGDRASNSAQLYVTTTRPREALEAMLETVDRMAEDALPEEEVRAAALAYITRKLLAREAAADRSDVAAHAELVAGGRGWTEALEERVRGIGPEEVRRAIAGAVRDLHFGVIGPASILGSLGASLFTSR